MADLTGQTPAATYKGLLQVNDYTDGVDATAKYIQDGEGTDSALAISTDSVGIGTTSPEAKIHIYRNEVAFWTGRANMARLELDNNSNVNFDLFGDNHPNRPSWFQIGGWNADVGIAIVSDTIANVENGTSTKGIFINNSNVGIGTTSPDANLDIDGTLLFSTNPTNSAWMLETGINNLSIKEKVGSSFLGRVTFLQGGDVTPGTDDAQDFGSATKRWDDIYATNGTIDTSDRELKQDIEELSEAETRVAQACKGLLRKYRWKSSVAEKGDDARIHFGIMAQDLEAAFAAEGLDAGRYGMFIKNTWWEADRVVPAVEAVEAVEAVYDDEGNEVSPAVEAVEAQPERTELDIFNNIEDAPEGAIEVTQRGVRYAELLAFIIAAI